MKLKIIILLLIIVAIPINADKIITNDVWSYVDSNDITYNEKSIGTIQLRSSSGNYIAVSVVNTTRSISHIPVNFVYNETNENISLSVEFNLTSKTTNRLYLSQEGGLPLFTNETIDGSITISINDLQRQITQNFTNEPVTSRLEGNPSRAIVTAETDSYRYTGTLIQETPITSFSGYLQGINVLYIEKEYVLSTDQTIKDDIRNYTISSYYTRINYAIIVTSNNTDNRQFFLIDWRKTLDQLDVYILYAEPQFFVESITNSTSTLFLSSLYENTMQVTFDTNKKLPSYIKQAIPTKIERGLRLSQAVSFIEYFLVDNKVRTEPSSFPLLLSFIAIPALILIKYKRRAW